MVVGSKEKRARINFMGMGKGFGIHLCAFTFKGVIYVEETRKLEE